jgi:hypothetical protein
MARKVKTLNPKQSKKPGRAPLVAALQEIAGEGASTFREVEAIYLRAMQNFDVLVESGTADQGDIQNGKGDFLNDMLAQLLANCSGKQLHNRPDVPGLSFRNHKLDVAYPASGAVQLVIETKSTGIPRHPRNKKQVHREGRAGSADLEKRIKEASLKNVDIKAEAARLAGKGGGPTTDLSGWLKSAPPRCFLFLAVRVRDEADLKKSVEFGHVASTWFDSCGVYCYGWDDKHEFYESKPVGATALELDRVLSNVCTALRAM